MSHVCSELGCEYKQLERSFQTVLGLQPKFFVRLVRFAGVLDELKTAARRPWPEIALDFGYFDQAHFNREFKAFTGVPPSQFRAPAMSITAMLTRAPEAMTGVSNSYKTPPVGTRDTAD